MFRNRMYAFFERLISSFPTHEQNKFNVIRWKDISSQKFQNIYNTLNDEFSQNTELQNTLLDFIEKYTERRNKDISREKKLYLCQYLLNELPTLLDGIHYNKENYRLIFYPTYVHSGMSELVRDIQSGTRFQNLRPLLGLKRTVMVEALISPTLQLAVDEVSKSISKKYSSFGLLPNLTKLHAQ